MIPKRHVLGLIGDGNRFSVTIMRKQLAVLRLNCKWATGALARARRRQASVATATRHSNAFHCAGMARILEQIGCASAQLTRSWR
jgi:hypothetical protein